VAEVFNFSPGPAKIPESVMQRARDEFLDWHGVGSSIMEVSHRGKHFVAVAEKAEQDLRDLLDIPDNYNVLFLQGGAQLQNAAIPMNLLGEHQSANYLETGVWSALAALEAEKYTHVTVSADMSNTGFHTVEPRDKWNIDEDGAYFYYCDNETVHGIEFHDIPEVNLPIIADMSSNLLTRKVDISKFGLIFACAQKNFGPAGVTIVIVKDELMKQRKPRIYTPSVIDYGIQTAKDSMKNTPPTFAWYMAGLVFEWVKEQGGVAEMDRRAKQRSQLVYDFLDQSDFYDCPIDPAYRSRMNIVFDLKDESKNEAFVDASHKAGLHYLKGHRVRGGMRASMYNAMPLAGAKKLVEFLDKFAK
jgi:phosphoserine aminotransferase